MGNYRKPRKYKLQNVYMRFYFKANHPSIDVLEEVFWDGEKLPTYTETAQMWASHSSSSTKPIISRSHKKLLIETLDFDSNISTLLLEINGFIDDCKIIVHGGIMSSANVWRNNRRSAYTGVFKNGDNWQAFISIKKRKTYLGTFSNQ